MESPLPLRRHSLDQWVYTWVRKPQNEEPSNESIDPHMTKEKKP
jgi:hypothetical protein